MVIFVAALYRVLRLKDRRVYFGIYTARRAGIYVSAWIRRGRLTGPELAETVNPSFLAVHPSDVFSR
jgi:hypothetical protein